MLPKACRLSALVFLFLFFQFSQSFAIVRRDNVATPTTTATSSVFQPTPTNSAGKDQDAKASAGTNLSSDQPITTSSITVDPSATQNTTSSALPTPTSVLRNSTLFNVTIPEGQLPLPPQLTPGWGVAGFIMLVTGVVYTLVGIKNRWIHTFFSTAYAIALAVAVLIVYVMNVPVSNALQAGYVIAVIISGCAVGAASMFFKELTEGFGCALGGFCLSMWLLCLVPGGLLQTVASKAIFIATFTSVGFALYFSRWTRDWALIILISFGGSTISILGVDCFSRAGLKEFWAYVWAINDNLFPLGANTYPVTKGIRVETAAVIFVFLAGIISQIKLWRIVREKRAKRAADRAEDQRNLEREEESVGRQIEELNAQERRQWERVYGDGTVDSVADSPATDFGDTGSEKKIRTAYISLKGQSSREAIEMADMSESDHSRHEPDALMTDDAEEGKITVRVAADDVPMSVTDVEGDTLDEKAEIRQEPNEIADAKKRYSKKRHSKGTTVSKRGSQAQTVTEAPEVIPLPFTVPEANDTMSNDRSSIATFADDAEAVASAAPQKRRSLAKRLSQGSASLLRNLYSRPDRTGVDEESTSDAGESTEELVLSDVRQPEDDDRSLAATVDDESVSDAREHPSNIMQAFEQSNLPGETEPSRRSIEINAQLSTKGDKIRHDKTDRQSKTKSRPVSTTTTPDPTLNKQPEIKAMGLVKGDQRDTKGAESSRAPSAELELPEASERAQSIGNVSSSPASLTKDRLPRSLSRVAMSYRTNEWAKHLSNAECPEPDELQVPIVKVTKKSKEPEERPASVNVEELQQTAEDGSPPPAVIRSISVTPDIATSKNDWRRSTKQEPPLATTVSAPMSPAGRETPAEQRKLQSPTSPFAPPLKKSPSALRHVSSTFMSIAEETATQPANDSAVEEEGAESSRAFSTQSFVAALDAPSPPHVASGSRSPVSGVVSYSSPQTLIGQRELFLRSKSHGNLLRNSPEPSFVSQGQGSDAGSLYNYPMYTAALGLSDPDNVPLNQRKELMRQSSLMSLPRSTSHSLTAQAQPLPALRTSESVVFDSHQPKRSMTSTPIAAREAQLANFRHAVQHDLRSGTPIIMNTGRETPFKQPTLLSGDREAEVQRNIEMQRHVLLGQKEAEAQRREMQRLEKEHNDRAFDERMRTGDMLEAHREAMRRMQKSAK